MRHMKKISRGSKGLSRPPLQRMHRIHEALLKGDHPNCTSLGLDLEVSYKTIQRDIDFMRDRLDLPIEYDITKNGFYYTEPVTNFPMVQVSEGELVALFVAEKALNQYKGTSFEKPLHAAFKKLTDGLTETISFSWSQLDSAISFKSIGTTVADLELFEIISKAVLRCEELEFQYRKLNSSGYEKRTVQPYHLGCIENQWYLFAQDLDRKQMRTFVLPRMKNAQRTGKRFTRPADFSVTKLLEQSFGVFSNESGTKEIRIWFDAFAAQLVRERRWHPSQKIKELENGELELLLKLGSFHEIKRWVLSWGEHAKVITPKSLVDDVQETLKTMASMYI